MDQPLATYDRTTRRTSNDGRREIFGRTHRLIAFVCECDAPTCFETVRMTAAEYDALRPEPVLSHGHRAER